MHPELIRIGDFVISSFGFMMVVAFFTGNAILRYEMKRLGKSPELADELTFRAAIGGILGAKFYYVIENIPGGGGLENLAGLWDILKGIFTFNGELIAVGIQNFGAGMVFFGGFIGGTLAVWLFVRKHKLTFPIVADWMAPILVLGHGIGRIGCFLVGDDYGRHSDGPWAIAFPEGAPPTTAYFLRKMGDKISADIPADTVFAVHPTQLYEMASYLTIFAFLWLTRKSKKFDGEIFSKYLILGGLARFIIEFIRLNPRYLLGLSGAQLISLAMISLGSTAIFLHRRKSAG